MNTMAYFVFFQSTFKDVSSYLVVFQREIKTQFYNEIINVYLI